MEDPKKSALLRLAARLRAVAGQRKIRGPQIEKLTRGRVRERTWNTWVGENPQQPGAIALSEAAKALKVSMDWLLYGDASGLLNESFVESFRAAMRDIPPKDKEARRRALAGLMNTRPQPFAFAAFFAQLEERLRPVAPAEVDAIRDELSAIWLACAPENAQVWRELLGDWQEQLGKDQK